MKAGTMEGLIGANINMKMADTPMRVFKEARRKGDLAAMERALGYAGDFTQKADEYKDKSEEELRKEMKEEREEQKARQEEMIEKRREEAEELREKTTDKTADRTAGKEDSVVISEDGRKILEQSAIEFDPAAKPEPTETKLYSGEGKAVGTEEAEIQISVCV